MRRHQNEDSHFWLSVMKTSDLIDPLETIDPAKYYLKCSRISLQCLFDAKIGKESIGFEMSEALV